MRVARFHELAPGGPEAESELIDLYLEHMHEQLARLRQAVAQNAVGDVELIAHRCAGTSSTCGADAVATPLMEIEANAKRGVLTGADRLLDAAVAAFSDSEIFLITYKARLSDRRHVG